MIINKAYLRVSTSEQDNEKFKHDILMFAAEKAFGHVDCVEEKISGTVPWKERKIGEIIYQLGESDRLIVPELSRLGRSMLEIMEVLSVAKERGISVYAVKGGWELNGSVQSKIMAMVFAMAAEIERDLISSRTKEALKARKAQGVKLGRPKGVGKSKLDKFRPEIEALLSNGSTQKFVAERYEVTPQNLINWLRKNGLERFLRRGRKK